VTEGLKNLKEIAKTLESVRRYLSYQRIMASSRLYAWWSVACLVGGAISLTIGELGLSPRAEGTSILLLWVTIGTLITRAYFSESSRIAELARTLLEEKTPSERVGLTQGLGWAVSFGLGCSAGWVAARAGLRGTGPLAVALCLALGLGNILTWASLKRYFERITPEPAVVGVSLLASLPLILSIKGEVIQYLALLLAISLTYAGASASLAFRARRVLLGGSK